MTSMRVLVVAFCCYTYRKICHWQLFSYTLVSVAVTRRSFSWICKQTTKCLIYDSYFVG